MYDPCKYPKSIATRHSLFKVHIMLQHFQRKFELYWYPVQYLRIDEKTIGFQGRHKDKLRIMFKDAGDGLQSDSVFDCGYTYSFAYINDGIPG